VYDSPAFEVKKGMPILTEGTLIEKTFVEKTTARATRFTILVAAMLLVSAGAILFARNSAAQEEKPPSLPCRNFSLAGGSTRRPTPRLRSMRTEE
jgi:hypothetical protein